MSKLYIVATPIGNLGDVSQRSLTILKSVDLILAEDTRVTRKLLAHFDIKTSVISYHQHSKLNKVNHIIACLQQPVRPPAKAALRAGNASRSDAGGGKNIALVSDAGTPGISDPGGKLVEEVVAKLGDEVEIITIPGPSAVTAAASISGFPMERFLFLGFPPAKRKRAKFFKEVIDSKYPVILYESPHRILKTLNELSLINNHLSLVVCRELTKKFETTYRGTPKQVIEQLKNSTCRGEFVIVINKV